MRIRRGFKVDLYKKYTILNIFSKYQGIPNIERPLI